MTPIEKVRHKLLFTYPILSKFLLPIVFEKSDKYPHGATDGVQIYYNSVWFHSISYGEQEFFIMHENGHNFLDHAGRQRDRNFDLWNIACDYEVNGFLSKFYPVPSNALFDPDFIGINAERIYSILDQRDKKQEQDEKQGEGDNEVKKQQEREKVGAKDGEVLKAPAPKKDEKTCTKDKVSKTKQEVSQLVKLLAKAGSSTSEMSAIKEFIEPKPSINDAIRSFVQTSVTEEENWSNPNKNFIQMGYYLPSFEGDGLINVVVGIDKSISLRKQDLVTFSEAVSSVLEEYHTEITIIYCDTKVKDVKTISFNDLPLSLACLPSGGTDFKPVFEYVNQYLEKQPTLLIYFTDLQCWSYPEEPDYPVLWVSTWKGNPPFGDVYYIKN